MKLPKNTSVMHVGSLEISRKADFDEARLESCEARLNLAILT
jgi:hypothetical protein